MFQRNKELALTKMGKVVVDLFKDPSLRNARIKFSHEQTILDVRAVFESANSKDKFKVVSQLYGTDESGNLKVHTHTEDLSDRDVAFDCYEDLDDEYPEDAFTQA